MSSCTSDACFPPGPAVPVDGGYRVSGQWAFGSGCQHTHWLQTMGIITDHGALRMGADGCQENTCGVAVVSRKTDGFCILSPSRCIRKLVGLPDHLVCQDEESRGKGDSQSLSGLEIQDEIELHRLLEGQFSGWSAFEDLVHMRGRTPV